jgi:hypothetical protein
MRYWKLEEIQRMLNQIEGYENVVIEFQCQQSDGWDKLNWDCKYGIKERLVNGQYSWLLKHMFVIEAKTELDAHNLAWQEAAERLITDVWRTSIHTLRKQQRELTKTKHSYSDPLPIKTINEVLANAERASRQLKSQTINKTNMTDETTNTTNMNNNIQANTTDTTDMNYPPMWKRLIKSFTTMMVVFMFAYAGMHVLVWLYDTLGMEHVMPTLIGLALWVAVYDHMYGTASKAPRP